MPSQLLWFRSYPAAVDRALLDPDAGEARWASTVRWRVFALTWLSYASYYLTRKPFSVAKADVQDDFGLAKSDLATIDTGYLAAYAVGQFFWGWMADKLGARRVLSFGMLASAACAVAFGVSSTLILFTILWTLNGFAQATGWSSNVKAMTAWFSPKGRGVVMGIWATCYQLGGLVANPIAGFFLVALSWRGAFHGPAVIVIIVAVLLFFFLPDVRLAEGAAARADASTARRAARSEVIRTPLVWALGASYFFMKLTRYALLFWLPYFMQKGLHYDKATSANLPLMFEAGGFVGSIAVGWISERWFRGARLSVGIVTLMLLAGALVVYGQAAYFGTAANAVALAVVGFLLFGPDTLLSATAAQDVGGPRAAATAAGFINGVGSIGPIVGGYFTAWASDRYGWSTVFSLLGLGSILSAMVLVPFWWRARRRSKNA